MGLLGDRLKKPEQLGTLQMRQTVVGGTNSYLLVCPGAQRQLLIDPGADPDKLIKLIASGLPRPTLDAIVVTHCHEDHLGALAEIAAKTHARIYAGYDDADAITDLTGVEVHRALRHGDTFQVGFMELEVIALRGHTPGSIAIALQEPSRVQRWHLFTGGALSSTGLGSTAADPGRFHQLYTDVISRIFGRFPDDTILRPGHGPMTSVGEERPNLRRWRDQGA